MFLVSCGGWESDCCKQDPEERENNPPAQPLETQDGENASQGAASGSASDSGQTQEVTQIEALPVRYGIDGPEWDSCGSYGEVSGLDPQGDNFLSVRAAPNSSAQELDRLGPAQGVWFCDGREDWIGIVYDKSGDLDCGAGSPIPEAREYEGPCKSGWVSERFVTLLAG